MTNLNSKTILTRFVAMMAALIVSACATVPSQVHTVLVDNRVMTEAASEVQLMRAGVSSPVSPRTTLESGDILTTGPGSQAVLLLENGAIELVMLENTTVRISSIWLDVGEIYVRVKKKVREVFEVESEYGVAGVEGTVFAVRVQRDGPANTAYQCITLEGQVAIRSPSNAWSPVRLRRGQALEVSTSGPPRQRQIGRREFNELIDRMNQVERIYRVGENELLVPDVVGLMEVDARRVLREQGLPTSVPTMRVTESVPIGQVLAQRPTAGSRVEANAQVGLDVEAEPTTVPELIGSQEQTAERLLQRARLQKGEVVYQITAESPKGEVLRQSPIAGDRVPVESSVKLWVEAESVKVPQLINVSLETGRQLLTDNGLVAGNVTEKLVRTGDVNKIVAQSVAAGKAVAPGTRVGLVVSGRGVEVPTLTNKTLSMATNSLANADLSVGRKTTRRSNAIPGRVVGQDPAPGTLVKPGKAVDIVTERGCTLPSVMGIHKNSASSRLSSAGFAPSIRNVGTYNSDNVTGQQPGAGGPLRCGTTVYLDLGTNIG